MDRWQQFRNTVQTAGMSLAVLVHAMRVTVAAALALVFAKWLGLRLPLWAVLTALLVTQMSIGRSLTATRDYLAGTFGGALYGGIIAALVPHTNEMALLAAMALSLAPLAALAGIRPSLSAAPVTAMIVLLVPEMTHTSPFDSATERVLEVMVGGATGFLVSLLVIPSSAHKLLAEKMARTLEQMALSLGTLLDGISKGFKISELHQIQDGASLSLQDLSRLSAEARQEKAAWLIRGPDGDAHIRTLLRIRHDIAIIGRAATVPMSEAIAMRLKPRLNDVRTSYTNYLMESAASLLEQKAPPSLEHVDAALVAFEADISAMRQEGKTRDLSTDQLERLFAVGFALEQLRTNFELLGEDIAEWTRLT